MRRARARGVALFGFLLVRLVLLVMCVCVCVCVCVWDPLGMWQPHWRQQSNDDPSGAGNRPSLVWPPRRPAGCGPTLSVAGGRLMTTRVRRSSAREVDRIAGAFEHCRSEAGRRTGTTRRRRRHAADPLLATRRLAVAALFTWSGGVLVTVGSRTSRRAGALVTSIRNQTTAATGAAAQPQRRGSSLSLADLTSLTNGGSARACGGSLDELIAGQSRYRSVYVADQSGRATSWPAAAPATPGRW